MDSPTLDPRPAEKKAADDGRGYVRSFNRYEIKYIVRESAAREFASELGAYMRLDPHSGEHGYPVYTVYWDSPQWTFFWEKLDGELYRRKLRFRRYGDSGSAFVEIKQRIDRTVQKRRVLWPLERIARVFDQGAIDPVAAAEVTDSAALEALFLCQHYRLAPRMAIAYRRKAWFGSFESDLRLTIDSRLQYDARALDLAQPFETGKPVLPPGVVVLEIKYDRRVPQWLLALVRRHDLQVRRLSKYCTAVDREFFQASLL